MPSANYLTVTALEVTVRPDGTWTWTKGGVLQASGRVVARGDGVLLEENDARNDAEQTIRLRHSGGHLWGMTRAFIPGGLNAVDLRRVGDAP